MARILVVDDEEGLRSFLAETLELDGHTVVEAHDGLDALKKLEKQSFHVMVTDLKMPRMDGMALLTRVRAEQPELEVIMLTAHGSVQSAVEAMRVGAFDYLQKPISSPGALRMLVSRALERHQLRAQSERSGLSERTQPEGGPTLTWGARCMAPVVKALQRVAQTDATVLLTGESGTGKEVSARAIHHFSNRREGPFVAINCAALSDSLLESELFGHEKGAFTGATARKRGRIELAEGGTFFLDEVGEMKPELQARLLRVLQERTFERIGGSQSIDCNVRWVAATNRDLQTQIQEGRFREDLYHRLAVFPIHIPPLRERQEDILPLARTLLERIGRDQGRPGLSIDPSVFPMLESARWSGNVRELSNALERAVILADGNVLLPEHFAFTSFPSSAPSRPAPAPTPSAPAFAARPGPPTSAFPPPADRAPVRSMADMEKEAIVAALKQVDGNRRRAAELLGIGLRTLYDKLKLYQIAD